jgi:hypothetical protein
MFADIADIAFKLTPAVSILGGIVAARLQILNLRRVHAQTIAKNHFRELLEAFSKNSDVLLKGMTDQSLSDLRRHPQEYLRYTVMYATCMFAMQEIFTAIDINREKNWANTIRSLCAIFKPFILADGVAFRESVDPKFRSWVLDALHDFEHPFVRSLQDESLRTDSTRPES